MTNKFLFFYKFFFVEKTKNIYINTQLGAIAQGVSKAKSRNKGQTQCTKASKNRPKEYRKKNPRRNKLKKQTLSKPKDSAATINNQNRK